MKTIPWLYCLFWKLNYFNHFQAPVRKRQISVSIGLVSVDTLQTSVLLSQALASANGWSFGNSTATAKNTSLPGPKPGGKKLRREMQKCLLSPFLFSFHNQKNNALKVYPPLWNKLASQAPSHLRTFVSKEPPVRKRPSTINHIFWSNKTRDEV